MLSIIFPDKFNLPIIWLSYQNEIIGNVDSQTPYAIVQMATGGMSVTQLDEAFNFTVGQSTIMGTYISKFMVARTVEHISTRVLIQYVFNRDFNTTQNMLDSVKFIQDNVRMKDFVRMYQTTIAAARSKDPFQISTDFQPISEKQLITINKIAAPDVIKAKLPISTLEDDLYLVLEENTMKMLFRFAIGYGN